MMLTIRPGHIDLGARVIQWALVAATVWIAAAGLLFRRPLPHPAVQEMDAPLAPPRKAKAAPSPEAFRSIWTRNLRQVLIEPEPQPVELPKPPPPPPPVRTPRLLATFVEDGQAWGLFVDGNRTVCLRTVAEQIGQFRVARISPGMAVLRHGRRTYKVTVPEDEPSTPHRRPSKSPW